MEEAVKVRVRADAEEDVLAVGDVIEEWEGREEVVEGADVKVKDSELELRKSKTSNVVTQSALDDRRRTYRLEQTLMAAVFFHRVHPKRLCSASSA